MGCGKRDYGRAVFKKETILEHHELRDSRPGYNYDFQVKSLIFQQTKQSIFIQIQEEPFEAVLIAWTMPLLPWAFGELPLWNCFGANSKADKCEKHETLQHTDQNMGTQ